MTLRAREDVGREARIDVLQAWIAGPLWHRLPSHLPTTDRAFELSSGKLARPGCGRRDERDMPCRLQIRRSKGWRLPANTLKVDRSTLFGNPFPAIDHGHDHAVALYRAWIAGRRLNTRLTPASKKSLARRRHEVLRALPTLRGKNLACWCPLPGDGEPDRCHAAVLLALANR